MTQIGRDFLPSDPTTTAKLQKMTSQIENSLKNETVRCVALYHTVLHCIAMSYIALIVCSMYLSTIQNIRYISI